jgi:hypothetical protein
VACHLSRHQRCVSAAWCSGVSDVCPEDGPMVDGGDLKGVNEVLAEGLLDRMNALVSAAGSR